MQGEDGGGKELRLQKTKAFDYLVHPFVQFTTTTLRWEQQMEVKRLKVKQQQTKTFGMKKGEGEKLNEFFSSFDEWPKKLWL